MTRVDRLGFAVVLALAACFERGGGKREVPPAPAPPPAPIAAGWRTAEPRRPPAPDATVRVALEAEPATLDPFATLDAASARVLGNVVEGLWCATAAGALEPCVAARHEVSADRRRWRFTLDPARRFSDGRPVTAADVVASLDAARGRGHPAGPLAGVLDDAVAVTAPAAGQVELVVAEDRPDRARDLALVPIVPADQLRAPSLAAAPIGTGPFAVASWDRGERVRLRRVAGARRAAAAANLELVFVADRADAIRRLAAGELDLVVQVPIAEAVAATAAHPELTRFRYAQPAYLAAIYNTRRPALTTAAARLALTGSLDRAGVAATILGGAATLTGPWLPDDPSYDPAVAPVPFARGAAPIAAPPALTVLVPAGSTTTARIADIWAADARGRFALTVAAVPFADLLGRLAGGDFDVALTSLSAGPEADPAARLASGAPAEQNWTGLADADLDALFAARRAATTDAERAATGRAIHRRIAALAPMAFIAVDTRAGLARADLGGVIGDGKGVPPGWRLWRAAR
ncbi:MAG: ABC transporter substrate-binding protein [Myxococcales bacterium]|nr:ABC transporter substrate-binding protein [Myxococcales bacterium]